MSYPSSFNFYSNPNSLRALDAIIHASRDTAQRDGYSVMANTIYNNKDNEVKSYVVSDSLFHALEKVDCEEVGPWHLQGTKTYHFILNKNKIKDGDVGYNEIYVNIIPPKCHLKYHQNSSEDRYKISIMVMSGMGEETSKAIYLGSSYKNGDTMKQILDGAKEDLNYMVVDGQVKELILKLTLNLILYIHSPEPQIMNLKPQVYNTRNFRENYFPKCKDEKNLWGIFSLGWDFHGREYSVEMGTRRGHHKWQPCGKLWSQRKLIFVEATTVNYSKSKS